MVVNSAHVLEKDKFGSRTVERRVGTTHRADGTSHLRQPMASRDLGRRCRSRPFHHAAVRSSPVPVFDGRLHAAPRHLDSDRHLASATVERVECRREHGVGQRRTKHHRVTVSRLRHYNQLTSDFGHPPSFRR